MHSLSKHENEPCLTCMSRICGYCHIYGCIKTHIWNTHECMTTSYVWYASCFHMCDLTHSRMWCDNDSFMWDMAHSRAYWVSVLSAAVCSWLIFGVAASYSVLMAHLVSPRMSLVCRRVLMAHSRCCSVLQCVAKCSWLILGLTWNEICATWLIHMCDMRENAEDQNGIMLGMLMLGMLMLGMLISCTSVHPCSLTG